MLISIPPKHAVSQVIGFIKGKSAIHLDAAIAGDQDGTSLAAAADELEEQVRGIGLQRQVTELINYQGLGLM
jgi:REP element-mobilizing transposase RayT